MKNVMKKGMSLLLVLLMVISLLPQVTLQSSAATVDYVYDGSYIYNWGQRGTTATYLSQNAEAFYADNGTSYAELSQLSGSSSTSSVPSSALYQELKSLMAGAQTYTTSYDATKSLFKYTDCQNSGGEISSFYSGTAIGPSWDGTWNREHTWPNSKGDAAGSGENDIMMLRPTASSENSSRGNKAYGESSSFYDPNEESDGEYNLHGDVARIMLFTYTRWGCTNTMWGSSGVMESLDVLLKWMEEDPVDTWELGRNDAVESITGTRNVYVDYPELAFLLFNEEIPADYQTPSGEGTASSYTVTATSNNTSYGTVSLSGKVINAAPKTGYYAAGYTVVSGSATVTQNGNAFTVDASSDCTVRIDFAPRTSLTLSFSENGTTKSQTVYAGDSISLPAASSSTDGYSFIGWTTGSVSDTTEKPDTVYTAGSSYTVNTSHTLYALYTYWENNDSTPGNVYQKYTGTLEEGDYVLTYETNANLGAMTAEVTDGGRLNYSEITLTDGAVENPDESIVWHIAPTTGGYTIYNESTSSYAAGTSTNNKATLLSSVTDYATWSVTESNGTYDFQNGGNSRYLHRNNNYGFACYDSSTGGALTLYKSSGGTVYYTTTATTCEHANTTEVAEEAATCTETGYTAGVYCNDCQSYISGHETVPATGHDWGEWKVITPAGCEDDGENERECETCFSVETQTVSATGHSYTSAVTDPTATEPGYTTYTCESCGHSYTDSTTYLVSFSTPAGVTAVEAQVCGENGISLPSAGVPTGEKTYTFVGWTTAQTQDSTDKPTVYTAEETYNAVSCVTLYALYSYVVEEESTGTGDYVKVTEEPADWSGEYVIVYEAESLIFDGSLSELDEANNNQSVTITDNTIPAAQADACKFTIATVDGGYSIQSAGGKYIGRTANSNGLNAGSTAYNNTITMNDDGTVNIVGSGGAYLRYNASSGQYRFRYYKSGSYTNQKAICLYVKDGSAGTTYYTTGDGLVKSWNLVLGSDICVNFVMNLTENDEITGVTVNRGWVQPTVSGNMLTVHVAAAQMTDEITIWVNDEPLAKTYTVAEYANIILNSTEPQATKDLVTNMLLYGGAAQSYFDYHTERPADSGIDAEPVQPGDEETTMQAQGSVGGIRFFGASLLHKEKLGVRLYFTGDIAGLDITVNFKNVEAAYKTGVDGNGRGYIELSGINSYEINGVVDVRISNDGGEELLVSYSPMDYILRTLDKTADTESLVKLKALVTALYSYYKASEVYAG